MLDKMSAACLEKALQALECPFTWKMPITDISLEQFLMIELEKRGNIEEEGPVAEFDWRGYPHDIELAYEFYKIKNDIKTGLSYVEASIQHMEQLLERDCQERFFFESKNALLHVALATKAHLLMADHREEEASSIVDRIVPLAELTTKEKAAVHGIQAAICIEYGTEGHKRALESALEASEINPAHAEWHFLAGQAMGRLRRAVNEEIKKEEFDIIKTAYSLDENNSSYVVYFAYLNSEISTAFYYDRSKYNYEENMQLSKRYAEKAIDLFKKAIALRPNCTSVKARAAHGYIRIKPMDLVDKCFAKQLLDDVLEKAPNNCFVHHDLGYFYDKFENNYEKAIESLETAHQQENCKAFNYLIILKWKCGRREEILGDLERALEQYTSEDIQTEMLAHAVVFTLLITEDWNQALTYANQCLKLDPSGKFLLKYFSLKGGRVNVIQMMRNKLRNHTPRDLVAESDKFIRLSDKLNAWIPLDFYRWKREQLNVGSLK